MTLNSAELIAETILQGFDAQYGRFLEVTSRVPSNVLKMLIGTVYKKR